MERLREKNPADDNALVRLAPLGDDMLARTIEWARTNTGSWNVDGLKAFAPVLADAFSELDAEVTLEDGDPFERVTNAGEVETIETAPVVRVRARPDAPVRIVMSGHYDTVFPPGTFTDVSDLGEGRWNGPGLADMKGGLIVMLEALKAFEASDLRERLGYEIVVSPDEEIGNFASARALREAASSGAMIGMTYEPAMESGAMSGGRKGSSVFDIVVRGRAAHAGRAKDQGVSAIETAAELVVALEAMNGRREGVSVNVGAIDGGGPVNIVPDLAVVRFGARAPDDDAAEWTTAGARRLVEQANERPGVSARLHGGFYRPPKPRNRAQQALFEAVAATGEAIGLSLEFADTGGVCEGNNIFAAGVPNVDTLGVVGGRIHSADEYVIASSFVERASLSALLLNRLADGRLDAAAVKAMMD